MTQAGVATLQQAAAALQAAKRLLVTCHLGPDGDSAGSMSALASLARAAGKQVTLYNPDPLPKLLKFLPHAGELVHKLPQAASPTARPYDLTVVLDVGDRKLLGDRFPAPALTGPLLVIDHHASGRPFGDFYLCDPAAPSVGTMVARLARALGWPLSRDAAIGLYVSLVTDTGWFRYANTSSEAFALAGELVSQHGVEPWAIAEKLGERATLARYRLLAAALGTIALEQAGKVAVISVTEEMVRGAGATWADTEGLVNYARALDGVECGLLLTPARDGKGTRVSLRSRGHTIDAGAVCLPLGGGGHRGAAGCRLELTLADARAAMLDALAAAFASAAAGAGGVSSAGPDHGDLRHR